MLQGNLRPLLKRLAVLSAFCVVIEIFRIFFVISLNYIFLPWNLLLAWIPVTFAIQASGEKSTWKFLAWLSAWLIFFPNAPYIMTDFLHLKPRDNFPFWYDSMLIYSFAFTGLMLGIVSALIIYKKLKTLLPAFAARGFLFLVMITSGYGIYVGRFLRYNSWDLITNPFAFFTDTALRLIHPTSYPRTYGVSLMAGVLLCLVFSVFESFTLKEEL